MEHGISEDYSTEEMVRNLQAINTDYDSICNIHRDIYHLILKVENGLLRKAIFEKLIIAARMSKKMSNKLLWYKNNSDD